MKNLRKKSEDPQVYVIPIKCLGRKSIQTFKKKKTEPILMVSLICLHCSITLIKVS